MIVADDYGWWNIEMDGHNVAARTPNIHALQKVRGSVAVGSMHHLRLCMGVPNVLSLTPCICTPPHSFIDSILRILVAALQIGVRLDRHYVYKCAQTCTHARARPLLCCTGD